MQRDEFSITGINTPAFRARNRQKGICQIDTSTIPMLPTMLRPIEYTTVAGEIRLLIAVNAAKNNAAISNFSINIIDFATSNLVRFNGIENIE